VRSQSAVKIDSHGFQFQGCDGGDRARFVGYAVFAKQMKLQDGTVLVKPWQSLLARGWLVIFGLFAIFVAFRSR
jgi:hypothetical protein